MRSNKQLRRTPGLQVEDASIHGGHGNVLICGWTGSVVWSRDEDGWEHVSVSPYSHHITPSWEDMCTLKDMFFDDEELALEFHPRKSQYVNLSKNCLHLWRPKDEEFLARLEGKQ